MNEIIVKLKSLEFLTIKKDSNATVTKQISSISQINKEGYEKQGIDFVKLIKNTHIIDMYQNISKKIFYDINTLGMSSNVTDISLDAIVNEQIREDKLKELFGEEIIKKSIYQNTQNTQRFIYMSVVQKINKVGANVIITNGSMGSALQDLPEFNSVHFGGRGAVSQSTIQYKIGRIMDCDVYVDAYMRFDDNKIFVGNVDYELSHNDTINFSNDFMEMEFGYDQKINPNSKVEVLNIIDSKMFLF